MDADKVGTGTDRDRVGGRVTAKGQGRGTAWTDRVKSVLEDERKATLAALLYYIIEAHCERCRHTRQCPEKSLMEEAKVYLNFVAGEQATWGDGTRDGEEGVL